MSGQPEIEVVGGPFDGLRLTLDAPAGIPGLAHPTLGLSGIPITDGKLRWPDVEEFCRQAAEAPARLAAVERALRRIEGRKKHRHTPLY